MSSTPRSNNPQMNLKWAFPEEYPPVYSPNRNARLAAAA
jgi:hypothetical protein